MQGTRCHRIDPILPIHANAVQVHTLSPLPSSSLPISLSRLGTYTCWALTHTRTRTHTTDVIAQPFRARLPSVRTPSTDSLAFSLFPLLPFSLSHSSSGSFAYSSAPKFSSFHLKLGIVQYKRRRRNAIVAQSLPTTKKNSSCKGERGGEGNSARQSSCRLPPPFCSIEFSAALFFLSFLTLLGTKRPVRLLRQAELSSPVLRTCCPFLRLSSAVLRPGYPSIDGFCGPFSLSFFSFEYTL
ncbi:hypothetical protein HDV62DRAFT_348144 [Trichoderma sp. SZMC 28011]